MPVHYHGIPGFESSILVRLGSMVTLIREAYFNKYILPLLRGMAEELAEAHSLFHLSAANNQEMPVTKYFEADISHSGVSYTISRVFGSLGYFPMSLCNHDS